MYPVQGVDRAVRDDAAVRDDTTEQTQKVEKKGKIKVLLNKVFGTEKKGSKQLVPNLHGLEELNRQGEEIVDKALLSALSSVVLCSESSSEEEKNYGSIKSPLFPRFSTITEEAVRMLSAGERMQLKSEIVNFLNRSRESSSSRSASTATSSESRSERTSQARSVEQNAAAGLVVIQKVQKELKDNKLIQFLTDRFAYPWFWDAMSLSNESIIDTKPLFSLICEHWNEALRNFSVHWIAHNRNTMLFQDAKSLLEKKMVIPPAAAPVKTPKISRRAPPKLLRIQIGNDESLNALIAKDLVAEQCRLYSALSPHHFIVDKWQEVPESYKQYISYQTLLADYPVDAILQEKDFAKRRQLISFFFSLCDKLLGLHDYASSASLSSFIRHPCIRSLVQTMNAVTQFSFYEKLRATLDGLFDDTHIRIMKGLSDAYIPCMEPFLNRLKHAQRLSLLAHDKAGEPEYNIVKIESIYKTIHAFLASQPLWQGLLQGQGQGQQEHTMQTDFVSTYIRGHKALTDEERWQLAKG